MLSYKNIFTQIRDLTANLISTGLCTEFNFSICIKSGNNIEIKANHKDNSVFLKSIPYEEMYKQLAEAKMFNIKMIDGALISFYYLFCKDKLVLHRLAFFPSLDLSSFQNEPELYLEDDIYADILDKRIVAVPMRFDFDNDKTHYAPVKHPISHLTLGQYKHCRTPVSSAITPYQFLTFIVMNFYHTAYEEFHNNLSVFKDAFEETVFPEEKQMIYVQTSKYN